MSTEAIRGGSEIIRGFANGQTGGRIAGHRPDGYTGFDVDGVYV
jgi:hypothetical protein